MTDKQPIYAELPADRYSKSGNVTDAGWYNIHDLRGFADDTHALRTQALEAQAPQQAAPMSPINRMIAYSAATKLRELGFAWDEASEAWLNPTAPQQEVPDNHHRCRLLTRAGIDALGAKAEWMDGNQWDMWVQEQFARANGLKIEGGNYD